MRRAGAVALAGLALLLAGVPDPAAAGDEPALPRAKDPGGVAVALVDSGVDYTLPHIASRLARDRAGEILGYDFEDDDRHPFDLAPGAPAGRGRHHGTRVATILLREAPKARLVPFRYKARAFDVFARIVERIAAGPARIVAMPLGGYLEADWEPLRRAMAAHAELLFVVSAGNDGRNIDERPVYPAAFGLANALVVTSTDTFGRLARESNWGTGTDRGHAARRLSQGRLGAAPPRHGGARRAAVRGFRRQ